MDNLSRLRRENLQEILKSRFASQKQMAEFIDFDVSYLSQMITGHRSIGERTARKLEIRLGLSSGSLDMAHQGINQPVFSVADTPPPIYGLSDEDRLVISLLHDLTKSQKEEFIKAIIAKKQENEQALADLDELIRRRAV